MTQHKWRAGRDDRNPHVVEVIRTVITRGDGKETVVRGVVQYHTLDGEFLAENDPCAGKDLVEDRARFAVRNG